MTRKADGLHEPPPVQALYDGFIEQSSQNAAQTARCELFYAHSQIVFPAAPGGLREHHVPRVADFNKTQLI